MRRKKNKKLIINADEFGSAPCVTDAIWECLNYGVLTSTTIVANGKDFKRAANLARGGNFCGLHLSLTDFAPLNPRNKISSLLRDDKEQFFQPYTFVQKYFNNKIKIDEVRMELEQQVERCLDEGIRLTHFDGHCNIFVLPKIFDAVAGLMKKYNVRKMRFPREPVFNIDWRQPRQYMLKTFIAAFSELGKRRLSRDIIFTDHFIGLAQSTHIEESVLLRLLKRLKDGSTEIPIHPRNYNEKQINDAFGSTHYASTYFSHGEEEKAALLSARVKQFIDSHGIELVSYGSL